MRMVGGVVRVEDARGQPPNMPFWLGEAPGRTGETSRAVSDLRAEVEKKIQETLGNDDQRNPKKLANARESQGAPENLSNLAAEVTRL